VQAVTDVADPRKLNLKLVVGKAEMQPRLQLSTKGSGMGGCGKDVEK
jgi:hypothetical protein